MKNKGADMDDSNFKALTGLRAIYEQRACPPDEVLFARERSMEMEAHLGYCRYCNERLEMTTEGHRAWQELGDRLKPLIVGNGQSHSPAPGQIWSLDRERLGGWGPYDRYYNPPLVLVLQLQDNGRIVRVAQVCAEEDLKGDDGADVWLDEGIGFAESWNVYSVHRDDLKVCRGEVDRSLAKQVLKQSSKHLSLKDVNANVQQFRELEVQVGAFVAMRAMPQVMAAVEVLEERETVALEEVLLQRELIKGLLLKVKDAGEVILTMAHVALTNIKENLSVTPLNVMEAVRTADLIQANQASKTEMQDVVNVIKEQKFPLVPIDIYTADDNTYISIIKTTRTETRPELVIAYKSSIVDDNNTALEQWETEHPVIVIKDLWISKSKLQHAGRLFEITLKDGKVRIDILPE